VAAWAFGYDSVILLYCLRRRHGGSARSGRAGSGRFADDLEMLLEGLEIDRAVVFDADKLTTKETYVAITRGSQRRVSRVARKVLE
jgi:hypothetical protein